MVEDGDDDMLHVDITQAGNNGILWFVSTTSETETMDLSDYKSLKFEIELPDTVDVEVSIYSGAAVETWAEGTTWPAPQWLAKGLGEFDTYFLPRGTTKEISISLESSLPRMNPNRMHQVQFGLKGEGFLKIGDLFSIRYSTNEDKPPLA